MREITAENKESYYEITESVLRVKKLTEEEMH